MKWKKTKQNKIKTNIIITEQELLTLLKNYMKRWSHQQN